VEEKYWVFVVGWFSGVGLKVDFDDFGGSKKPVETFQSLFRTTKVLSPQLKKKPSSWAPTSYKWGYNML